MLPDPVTGMLPQPTVSSRTCEVHMNSFTPLQGSSGFGGSSSALPRPGEPGGPPASFFQALVYCFRTRGLLSKFPSRAKRIDVISRFIFPLIFAIFNLAYWLYYLFAESKSPQLDQ